MSLKPCRSYDGPVSYTICAIIILRGPWGSKRTCLCAVYSVVAVTCMQGHEHRSTMSAKVVADYKIHIRDVRWARGQFVRVGWQGGRQDGLFVVGFLGGEGGDVPENNCRLNCY